MPLRTCPRPVFLRFSMMASARLCAMTTLTEQGVQVDIMEDAMGIALYGAFRRERPALDLEDWRGLAAVNHHAPDGG